MYGKQLNGSDAQALDIIDGSLMPKPLKCAAQLRGKRRIALGKTLHMRFVDNRMRPGDVWAIFPLPVEGIRVDNLAFWRKWRAIAGIKAQIFLLMAHLVAEMRIVPFNIAFQLPRVGIDKQFMWIKAMAVFRIVRPINPITV